MIHPCPVRSVFTKACTAGGQSRRIQALSAADGSRACPVVSATIRKGFSPGPNCREPQS